MRRILATAALLLLMAGAAAAGEADRIVAIANAVGAWEPFAVTVSDGGIAVAFDRHSIDEGTYRGIIVDGICAAYGRGPFLLDGISEVAVLDREQRGWVYDGGAKGCAEINASPETAEAISGWNDSPTAEAPREQWLKITVMGHSYRR